MAHLKVLRGNLARQIINYSNKNNKKSNFNQPVLSAGKRCLATQTATVVEQKYLNSQWGEIDIGKETLTQHVFSDFELWADKPALIKSVSYITLSGVILSLYLQRENYEPVHGCEETRSFCVKSTNPHWARVVVYGPITLMQGRLEPLGGDIYRTCGVTGRSYDYGMMRLMIERCAHAFLGALKLTPGDKVGLILPNIPEFAVVIHGAIRAGLVVTFANPLYTAEEVRRQFADCDVKAICTIEMFMPVAKEVSKSLKDYKGTIWVGGEDDKAQGVYGLKTLLMADHKADIPPLNCDDVCLIPYSSGTTGMPKGVMLTHKNLVCNLKQIQCPKMMKYEGEKGKCDVVLTVPPFFHIYGFNGILNYNLILGYHLVSIPKFTPEDYIKCLVKYKPTTLFVVPSLLAFLATHPLVKKEHLESVETIMVGAAPTTDSMLEKFLLKCEKTKDEIRLLQGYGMTESSPVTLMTPYVYPYSKVGSCGQLVSSTQARVVSLSTGDMLGAHKSGELLLRGPQVMKGYWRNETATKETVDSDGWLHTGDVAYYDEDHYFYIVDRTKELIKVKGNQVSPTEIESVVMELPEIADVAVVGVPDPLAGEVPRAFVVLKPAHKLDEKHIYDCVAQKLTKYKRLEGGVAFIESIPRNAAGKIMRNELKVLGVKTRK